MDFCCQFLRKELCKNKKKVTPLWDGYPKQINIITIEPIAELHHENETIEVNERSCRTDVSMVEHLNDQETKSNSIPTALNTSALENDAPNDSSDESNEHENCNKNVAVNQGLQYLANQIQYFNFQNHSTNEECSMQTFVSNSSHYLDITEMSHVDFDDPKDVNRHETKEDTIAKDIEVVDLDDGETKEHFVNENEDYDKSKYFFIVRLQGRFFA